MHTCIYYPIYIWVNFLQKGTTTDPDLTFYQYVGEIFDEILEQHCPTVQPNSRVTSQKELSLSYEEQNAAYIPLKGSAYQHTLSKIS